DQKRDPKRVGAARRDLRFGRVEVLHLGQIMSHGEHAIKSPRAAEFKCRLAIFRIVRTAGLVLNRSRVDALEDVPGDAAADKRLPSNQPNRRFGERLELRVGEIVLRFIETPSLSGDFGVWNLL